jgi:hypothetical protein
MAAGMALGAMAIMHYLFDVNTCPWIPPNCPTQE